ncbi:MAG TPA: CocE/NonD family hydrolase, partial [Nitriliruptorales bacterium]
MTRVSTFGEYQGYSDERYDRVTRSSVYAPLRDGVEVAADIYRPGTAQGPASERLPVVLMVTRYWRAKQLEDGVIASPLGLLPAGETQIALNTADIRFHEPVRPLTLHRLAAHGYVVVVMENRGTGSSFGVMGQPSQQDSEGPLTDGMMNGIQYDLHDMVEWCAQQPFGNGRVAMAGGSWLGWMQLAAAVGRPPSLQATFPRVPSALHGHRIFHFGGLFFKGAMVTMGRTLIQLAKGEQDQMA